MIVTLQRQLMEVGRIRIGQKVESQNGKKRPTKLDTFRLTSRDPQRIETAAGLWGGTPAEWDSPSGKQWEVVTEAAALDVIVPPSEMAFSQFYELWAAGGCKRRCDGVTETISEQPCLCDPDNRDCSIHTRLSVMLSDLPGLGVWRVDTSGYYAAIELGASVQVIAAAAGHGAMLPARLRLEQRTVKRPDQQRRNFAVPVLDVDISPAQLMASVASAPQVEGPQKALLTPVPDIEAPPAEPVADQAQAFPERKRRKNSAQPIPPTGVEPRKVDEVPTLPPQLKEIQAHIGSGAITGAAVVSIARRVVKAADSKAEQPKTLTEVADLDPETLEAVVEAVAEKIAGEEK